MPYICMTRTDIPDGVLQVLDLFPNTSQRNQSIAPQGQTAYINRVSRPDISLEQPAGAGNPLFLYGVPGGDAEGLAAYLMDRSPADGAVQTPMTAQEAMDAADAIITLMDTATTAMTEANINAAVQAVGGGLVAYDLLGGAWSTATLTDVLSILAGRGYTVPAGSQIATTQAAGGHTPAAVGAFGDKPIRHTYASGSLNISIGAGYISEFIIGMTLYGVGSPYPYRGAQQFQTMTNPLTQAAGRLAVVYADDGTILG